MVAALRHELQLGICGVQRPAAAVFQVQASSFPAPCEGADSGCAIPPTCKSDGCAVPNLKGEEKSMEKKIIVEGMMCQNCVKHVTKALNDLPGVTATVDLDSKTAIVTGEVSDDAIRAAITEAGYEVTSIQ